MVVLFSIIRVFFVLSNTSFSQTAGLTAIGAVCRWSPETVQERGEVMVTVSSSFCLWCLNTVMKTSWFTSRPLSLSKQIWSWDGLIHLHVWLCCFILFFSLSLFPEPATSSWSSAPNPEDTEAELDSTSFDMSDDELFTDFDLLAEINEVEKLREPMRSESVNALFKFIPEFFFWRAQLFLQPVLQQQHPSDEGRPVGASHQKEARRNA